MYARASRRALARSASGQTLAAEGAQGSAGALISRASSLSGSDVMVLLALRCTPGLSSRERRLLWLSLPLPARQALARPGVVRFLPAWGRSTLLGSERARLQLQQQQEAEEEEALPLAAPALVWSPPTRSRVPVASLATPVVRATLDASLDDIESDPESSDGDNIRESGSRAAGVTTREDEEGAEPSRSSYQPPDWEIERDSAFTDVSWVFVFLCFWLPLYNRLFSFCCFMGRRHGSYWSGELCQCSCGPGRK